MISARVQSLFALIALLCVSSLNVFAQQTNDKLIFNVSVVDQFATPVSVIYREGKLGGARKMAQVEIKTRAA